MGEEIAEVKACFADKALVLTETAMMNPPPATTQERIDYLTNKGIPEKSIKAAMTEIGVEQIEYQRDPWGRIVARNDIKSHPTEHETTRVISCRLASTSQGLERIVCVWCDDVD